MFHVVSPDGLTAMPPRLHQLGTQRAKTQVWTKMIL
jgi:hypothetical protein